MKMSFGRKLFQGIDLLVLICAALLCIAPFVNVVAISFSNNSIVAAGKIAFWPQGFTLSSYEYVLRDGQFFTSFGVSIQRVVLGTGTMLVLMCLTAYPLARGRDELMGRGIYAAYFVLTMLIGGGLIPTYLLISRFKLMDTIWALIVLKALPVYSMFILMNFMRGLPKELEEAAFIDGASPIKTLLRIIVPISKPALATVSLFCIVDHWNSWFDGMIYMNSQQNFPLQTYLRAMINELNRMMQNTDNYSSEELERLVALINMRTTRGAIMFLAAIPMLVVYPFLQKYFTKGLVLGSVKG